MPDTDHAHYRAAGRSLAAVLAWVEARERVWAAQRAFVARHGAEGGHFIGPELVGLCFGGEPPAEWKRKKGEGWAVPNERLAEGRRLRREMKGLVPPRRPDEAGRFHVSGGMMHIPQVEPIGSAWVITQHKGAEPPPDAVRLKRSEYWALRERQEEGKEASPC